MLSSSETPLGGAIIFIGSRIDGAQRRITGLLFKAVRYQPRNPGDHEDSIRGCFRERNLAEKSGYRSVCIEWQSLACNFRQHKLHGLRMGNVVSRQFQLASQVE